MSGNSVNCFQNHSLTVNVILKKLFLKQKQRIANKDDVVIMLILKFEDMVRMR